MTITRLQFATGLALMLGVLAAGAGVAAHRLLAADAAPQAAPSQPPPPAAGQPARPAAEVGAGIQSIRQSLVRRGGGNERSEAAVKAGLEWLLEHQAPDGRWSLDDFCQGGKCNCDGKGAKNDVAGTAFGLLPLLGAGLTPQSDGEQKRYGQAVARGLKFLVSRMNKDGDFGGGMYAHGLATMALARAYGLTRDPQLLAPAQRAVDYIVKAQHHGGGWRYAPGQSGDTSVTSWQVQALKTAQLAGLRVPKESLIGAGRWLDSVQGPDGGYGYTGPRSTPTMTAAGLLSRQYLGWSGENPGMHAGLRLLAQIQPGARSNLYHDYHATLVMMQAGGEEWPAWNTKMRDRLLELQDRGADAKRAHQRGSWWPAGDPYGSQGGRMMTTSLALLCLEVYYRNDLLLASRPPRDLSAREAEALWADLTGEDLLQARQAMWDLARAPRRAVPMCQEQLKPAAPPDGGNRELLARLIGDLDSDNFSTREQATRELEKLGERAEPALRRTLEDRPTLEVRQRIEQILQKRKAERAAALVRTQRALEVLEHSGTPEARELLKTLSQGDPDAVLTREAKAALARVQEK